MPATKTQKLSAAECADKHVLYQLAVQSPEADIELLAQFYRDLRSHEAYHFREDFCGTGLTLSHWIQQGKKHSGEGFDIDPTPLDWGREHNFDHLGNATKQAVLHCDDVRKPSLRSPDLRCAFNFSYWVFTERATMLDYFSDVYRDLAADGIFVVDIHGGPESISEDEYESECDEGFSYIWHQQHFSPVDHNAELALHFRFADGSSIDNAFTYNWRIWSMPEIIDLMTEAGFNTVEVYWEGQDEEGYGNGQFNKTIKGHNQSSWIACLVAIK